MLWSRAMRKHEAYIVPGLVDGAVVRKQAEVRRDKEGEETIVHDHAYLEPIGPYYVPANEAVVTCNWKCTIYQPGLQTISYLDYLSGAAAPPMEES